MSAHLILCVCFCSACGSLAHAFQKIDEILRNHHTEKDFSVLNLSKNVKNSACLIYQNKTER